MCHTFNFKSCFYLALSKKLIVVIVEFCFLLLSTIEEVDMIGQWTL